MFKAVDKEGNKTNKNIIFINLLITTLDFTLNKITYKAKKNINCLIFTKRTQYEIRNNETHKDETPIFEKKKKHTQKKTLRLVLGRKKMVAEISR